MTLSLRLIEQAVVLGETGNFARASERLGITQPTLTRNIAALEANLGMRLFDRGRGGAAPTVFGQTVIERGATLVRDADALRTELKALAGLDTGQLTIAAGPYAADDLVGPAVARLVNLRPGLRVRVTVVGAEVIAGGGAVRPPRTWPVRHRKPTGARPAEHRAAARTPPGADLPCRTSSGRQHARACSRC